MRNLSRSINKNRSSKRKSIIRNILRNRRENKNKKKKNIMARKRKISFIKNIRLTLRNMLYYQMNKKIWNRLKNTKEFTSNLMLPTWLTRFKKTKIKQKKSHTNQIWKLMILYFLSRKNWMKWSRQINLRKKCLKKLIKMITWAIVIMMILIMLVWERYKGKQDLLIQLMKAV